MLFNLCSSGHSWQSHILPLMFLKCVLLSTFSFLIVLPCIFFLSVFVKLALCNQFYCSSQTIGFGFIDVLFHVLISLIFVLIFIIFFFLSTSGLFSPSFSSYYIFRLDLSSFSNMSIQCCKFISKHCFSCVPQILTCDYILLSLRYFLISL